MQRTSKSRGGRKSPPKSSLIGRTEIAKLFQCDKKWIRRHYQKKGFLHVVLTDADGTEWFDREVVMNIAATMNKTAKRKSGTKLRAARSSNPTEPAKAGYYPEHGARREPFAPAPRPPLKARSPAAKEPSRNQAAASMPRGLGPQTEILNEWWDGELPSSDEDAEPEE